MHHNVSVCDFIDEVVFCEHIQEKAVSVCLFPNSESDVVEAHHHLRWVCTGKNTYFETHVL